MSKVKQKVSGEFKTENGAQVYAVIGLLNDTCIKNGQNILGAFKTIATLQAENLQKFLVFIINYSDTF